MKKAVGQMKNGLPGPGQDKDTLAAGQRVSEWHPGKFKRDQVLTLLFFDVIHFRGAACVVACVPLNQSIRNNQTVSIMIVSQGAQSKGGKVKSGATRNTSKLSRYAWRGVCISTEGTVNP